MTAWWAYHIKRKEQLNYYHSYVWDKCSYPVFFARIHKHWYSYEEAINPESMKWKHMIKTEIKEDWRVCTKCLVFKPRNKFSKTKSTTTRRSADCLECRRKRKQEYRKKTNYNKDHEYKKIRRKLEIWTIITMEKERYIDWLPREDKWIVEKYEFKKWYLIKSLIDWIYKRIDLWDNGTRPKFFLNPNEWKNETKKA